MKMYRHIMLLLCIFTCSFAYSQSNSGVSFEYAYDAAGNRISRTVITFPENRSVSDSIANPDLYAADGMEESDQDKSIGMNMGDVVVDIYPNPVKGELYLEVNGTDDFEKVFFEVIDVNGRVVANNRLKSSTADINFSNMEKGIYFLRLFINDEYKEYKVVKN